MNRTHRRRGIVAALPALALLAALAGPGADRATVARDEPADDFTTRIRPFLKTHCLSCHSTRAKKGELDLERFATLNDVRGDLKPWQAMIEQIESGEMPPKHKPQPSAADKKTLVDWIRGTIAAEARARRGDPGRVPLRRLSNAEYDATVRDLTGVDLRPTREFPADGAAGEGFTNAAEALTDISPTLFTKYLNAAREIADHAVLLPDGLRFSPARTRRDWSDEGVARLRAFYARYTGPDGKLAFRPYLAATVRHREALTAKRFEAIAVQEKLNANYLRALWTALADERPSYPLDAIRARWRTAGEADLPAIAAEIEAWQAALWQTARIGSYFRPSGAGYTENPSRQYASAIATEEARTIRLALKPEPGQADIVLRLAAQEFLSATKDATIDWARPRFEAPGQPPLPLMDYARFGPAREIHFPTIFAATDRYLAAVADAARKPKADTAALAKTHGLNADLLRRWIEVIALDPEGARATDGRPVPFAALTLLDTKAERIDGKAAITGWHARGAGLPIVMANASDTVEQIPGRAAAHAVVVHPMPKEFVGIAWTSPLAGRVKVRVRIAHAHPSCGNGVAWWLERRRGERAVEIAAGGVELGKEAKPPESTMFVEVGDELLLAVDAKDANHVCDLTEVALVIEETAKPNRKWDLSADVANTLHAGNPHADGHGNKATWRFVKGPTRARAGQADPIPAASVLGRWKAAGGDPQLAIAVRDLLVGPRPADPAHPDRLLYDHLVTVGGALLKGLDAAPFSGSQPAEPPYGVLKAVHTAAGPVVEIRLPAALFVDRVFVVDAALAPPADGRAAFVQAVAAPGPLPRWDGRAPLLVAPGGTAPKTLADGFDQFRNAFPLFLCFPPVIPTDEVVSLKMFHREDEPLRRLFLDATASRELEHLWTEHRFVSEQARLENEYLPQFIGFVTQDQPKAMVAYVESLKPAFRERAEAAARDRTAAEPKHLDAVLEFAGRAYRRPLTAKESGELRGLYRSVRATGTTHDEAIRGALLRVLVSPAFLFRIEAAPPGRAPGPVNDWELASRLSYFLWSSMPDRELCDLAAAGRLHEPSVLEAQTRRLLADPRARALAIEFGTQWIHVRGFDAHAEKNEKLYPGFDAPLRAALYEEAILIFQDLFQADRPLSNLLDSDATFLNATLAKHYGIPGIVGPEWRRVEGVRKYGRGGLLGLGSVLAKQSGASRTSPVLRGNWVVETLLGEKLPKPPPNVPKLPDEEGTDRLTTRQQVERHVSDPSCAACHVRIDPFGFALERYDAIGRRRDADAGGLALDTRAKLRDGTTLDGFDGLRNYLLTTKRKTVERLYCQRLLGYALGRAVTLSDSILLDEMMAAMAADGGRVQAAVRTIVNSPQFRSIRGADAAD